MNKVKQFYYKYVTTPIAKVCDIINFKKHLELRRRREHIAQMNKKDYIEQLTKNLVDTEIQEHLEMGVIPNPLAMPIIIKQNLDKAYEIFYEKKAKGYFDELNIQIKYDEDKELV